MMKSSLSVASKVLLKLLMEFSVNFF